MVKISGPGRVAVVAALGAVALLGTAAQSASAAPAAAPRAAFQTASAPGTSPSRAMLLRHPASPATLNCVYEVVEETEFITANGIFQLYPGALLWGPQGSGNLYSLGYQLWGTVYVGNLYEQYCDP
jgi:hypothetical protein